MDLIEALMETGLTKQESRIYIELAKQTEMTGYEAAKRTSIARSNAYHALKGLVTKGASNFSKGEKNTYVYVPCEEYVNNIKRNRENVYAYILNNMPSERNDEAPFITILGRTNIENKIRNLINNAKTRIYFSVEQGEYKFFKQQLIEKKELGKKVVVISNEKNKNIDYVKEMNEGPFSLIVDSCFVLTGELYTIKESNAIYSKNNTFVKVMKDALSNEIKLIKREGEK